MVAGLVENIPAVLLVPFLGWWFRARTYDGSSGPVKVPADSLLYAADFCLCWVPSLSKQNRESTYPTKVKRLSCQDHKAGNFD